MPTDIASTSTLQRLHATVFSAGIIAVLLGIVISSPYLLLAAGVCFAISGLLIFVGSRISLRGPLGDALRLALGRRRMFTVLLRGIFWVVLGLLLILLAAQSLRDGQEIPLGPRIAA